MVVPVNGDGVMVVVKAMLFCAAAMYLLAAVVRSLGADPRDAITSSKVSAILMIVLSLESWRAWTWGTGESCDE